MPQPTSPTGERIEIRPIAHAELDLVPMRCWPQDPTIVEHLFAEQGTIGMAAWEGSKCVAQLHCYRITLPAKPEDLLVDHLHYLSQPCVDPVGVGWCHACIHVGRTLQSYAAELRHHDEAATIWQGTDQRYFGHGIGTALCEASVNYARQQGYHLVLAHSAPSGLFNYAIWSGELPWTTYTRLGFTALGAAPPRGLPAWAEGDAPPEVLTEARAALANGRPSNTFYSRTMMLHLD